MSARLSTVVIDANDPAHLARFWSGVLGWDVIDIDPDDDAIEIGPAGDVHVSLLFVPVPEPKSTKNRFHLDVNPRGCDQAEELERLLALGAVPADVGQGEQTWVVLADPEGNEFCLLSTRIDD